MKKSLKQKLHDTLKEHNFITYAQLEALCHQWGYKLATAERVLRPSSSPQVKRIEKNGAIIRYEWLGQAAVLTEDVQKRVDAFMAEWGTKEKKTEDVLF